jgi:hypothetical protein
MGHISSVYVDYVNLLGENIHTTKRNIEALLVASTEIAVDVSTGKAEFMLVYRE